MSKILKIILTPFTNAADHKVRVKVLYDYEARDEDEISLKQGEFLDEIKPEDDQGEFYCCSSCHFCDIQAQIFIISANGSCVGFYF